MKTEIEWLQYFDDEIFSDSMRSMISIGDIRKRIAELKKGQI